MRHIHVELGRKEASPAALELPAREGDLPPPASPPPPPTQGGRDPHHQGPGVGPGDHPPGVGVPPGDHAPGVGLRPLFGQEELRIQKVYQLSIFSQRTAPLLPCPRPPAGGGVKRGLGEPPLPPSSSLAHNNNNKRPHLEDSESDDEGLLEGGVLCGPGPPPWDPQEGCGGGGGLSPRSPPLSPSHTPSRRPAQHNHDRPVPDVFASGPLSPKSPPRCCGPTPPVRYCPPPGSESCASPGSPGGPEASPTRSPSGGGPFSSPTRSPSGGGPFFSSPTRSPPGAGPFSSPTRSPSGGGPFSSPTRSPPGAGPFSSPTRSPPRGGPFSSPTRSPPGGGPFFSSPTRSPPGGGPFSPPHHSDLPEPGEATEWEAGGLESSPPERSATTQAPPPSPCQPTTTTLGPAGGPPPRSPPPCAAKRRLLLCCDGPSSPGGGGGAGGAGDSCSEDEGPSTSKRSRGPPAPPTGGLGGGRSTDAKAAPYWNHLLPAAMLAQRDHRSKSAAAESSRSARRLNRALRLKSRQLRSGRHSESCRPAPRSFSRALLGNFEESMLKGRFSPSGRVDGFTAEIGASGSYCPQHATLPVGVTYYHISEHSAPSPFLGVISLDTLGKKGYSVPKAGTIQVTLFNPNKTVVKMFLVTYDFGDMPVNHMTFLRQRLFLVPVEEGEGPGDKVEGPGGKGEGPEAKGEAASTPGGGVASKDRKKILCYLIHLRFQSSKSGKVYLHDDIRLLFSRKSIEVDTMVPYELKSFTERPRNPTYSPRV